ncbi:MAG TPA: M23 family metallopeptidase [Gemmatimonadales bacterium]|nr:M23 family metallopeptidase [Gemmatimonadales bacterium]
MSRAPRAVTIVIQQDGATRSQTYRVPVWMLRAGVGFMVAATLAAVVVAALYGPLLRSAVRVPGLERQVAKLEADNAKVHQLITALDSVESRYAQVRQMVGGDIVRDPLTIGAALPVAPSVLAHVADLPRGPSIGLSVPRRWPLEEAGYVTRGQIGTGTIDEAHPGVDIAVASGSIVRASGGGTVHQLGEDPEYGLFVLLDHPQDYQTMYGHLSRILVEPGASVAPGQVIGLTGNTGRSTAPHLHFEIRQKGVSLDPRTMVKEGS